jgi:hypothetical protein
MASKPTLLKGTIEEQLANLEAAVEAHLAPGVCLAINGMPQDQEGITATLQQCREAFAEWAEAREKSEKEMAEWPALVLEARVFARAVKAALLRHVAGNAPESRADAAGEPLEGPNVRRCLAAAKRAPTREIRGIHLRRRPGRAPGGRLPWVE